MEGHAAQGIPPIEKMGPRIRRLRKRLDLTQAQLGDLVGVQALAVGDWERGKYEPKGENLVALADALRVSPHYVVYGESGVYREAVERIAAIVEDVRSASSGADDLSIAADADDGGGGEGMKPG